MLGRDHVLILRRPGLGFRTLGEATWLGILKQALARELVGWVGQGATWLVLAGPSRPFLFTRRVLGLSLFWSGGLVFAVTGCRSRELVFARRVFRMTVCRSPELVFARGVFRVTVCRSRALVSARRLSVCRIFTHKMKAQKTFQGLGIFQALFFAKGLFLLLLSLYVKLQ